MVTFFSRELRETFKHAKKTTLVWIFCWSCHPLFLFFFFFCSLFRCGNLIFGVPLRRGNGHKGGEVKVQSPRLGGLWWSAWELEKGKLWLEYEWNHRRGGRGEGKEEGRGERRIMAELLTTPWIAKEDFLLLVRRRGHHHHRCYSPTPCSHLCGEHVGRGGSNITWDTVHRVVKTNLCLHSDSGREKWLDWVADPKGGGHLHNRKLFRLACKDC